MATATGSSDRSIRPCLFAWLSVLRFGLSIFLISFALSLLALPWLHLSWWRIFRRCVSIGAAISVWLCARMFEHRSLGSYGLSGWGTVGAGPGTGYPRAGAGKHQFVFGLLLGLGTLGVVLAIGLASGAYTLHLTPDRWKLWRVLLGFLPAAPLVGLLEELTFRGFLLRHLMNCSKILAVVVSSALYAFVHLKTTIWTAATTRELVGLFLLGTVLAVSCLRTGRLYMAIGLHTVLAYGARVNKVLLEFTDPSSAWLVGTSRLVNGVASWIALLGIGTVVVWWTQPQRRGGGTA